MSNETLKDEQTVVEKHELNIFIKNKNTLRWWDDIIILGGNKQLKIVACNLPVVDNYEITHLIQSYHSFVEYHNMLVTTINNKPLSLAYLKIVNFKDILLDAEKLEKDVAIFKTKIQMLELHIKELIEKHVITNEIILEEKTITKSFFNVFASIFRLKKHSKDNPMVQFAVTNNLARY